MRILFFFSSLLIIASCSQSNYAKYGPIYEKEELSLLPDYSNLNYWAAHPNKKNPSETRGFFIKFYEEYLEEYSTKRPFPNLDQEGETNSTKVSDKMGYISSVDEARKKLEDIYKNNIKD